MSSTNPLHPIPLSYGFAVQLCQQHPQADPDIVLPAIILHDTGWAVIDERTIFEQGFGPNMMESEVRRQHEIEGARIARELLTGLSYPVPAIEEIDAIIDGHDTRRAALSLNDELVKDADKLWRFTVSGVRICHTWTNQTPEAFTIYVGSHIADWMLTEHGATMAHAILEQTRHYYATRSEDESEAI